MPLDKIQHAPPKIPELVMWALIDAIENGGEKCVKDAEVVRVLEILEEATEVAKSHAKEV